MGKAGKAVEAQRPATARSGAPQSRKGSGIGLISALVAVTAVCLALLSGGPKEELPEELWPFPAPKLTELGQFQGTHAERLLWGTYRPGFYFGMRMRVPRSVVVGLMWLDPSKSFLDSIRHEAQQSDGLERYGWLQHDGETFGVQELLDGGLALTTSWAKRLCEGCGQGGDWGARVMADVRAAGGGPDQAAEQPQAAPARVTLFVYVATEDDSALQLDPAAVAAALERPAAAGEPRPAARGRHAALGPWALYLSPGADPSSPRPTRVSYWGARAAHTHNLTQGVKDAILQHYYQQHAQGVQDKVLTLPNEAARRPSLAVFQIDTLTPAALDVSFLSGPGSGGRGDGGGGAGGGARAAAPRHAAVAGRGLDQLLERRAAAFERRFADTFGPALRKGGGDGAQQPGQEGELPEGTAEVAKAALANMLGGMGYWHGSSLVRLPQPPPGAPRRRRQGQQQAGQQGGQEQPEAAELWPAPLYSAVPSRSFFPRGFLWDEGFHQLLIRRWSPALSREVLAHWFDLMNAQGWIAREQILGEEARARVPSEFVVQSPSAANPPTFFLVLADMSRQVVAATQAAQASGGSGSTVWDETTRADAEFLVAAWPRLVTWYRWFNTSQAGQEPGAYRWRGRVADSSRELNPKTLTSGLDDYPRASHPTDDERHVDLRCWMALASRALATIGSNLGLPQEEVAPFEETALRLESLEELNRLHWDAESGQYRDWGLHTEGASLQQEQFTRPDGSVQLGEWRRVVNEAPARRLVPQFGYVSLFPLLMRLLPAGSAELGRQLELLRDPGLLWTPYGLRSLAASASLYQARNTEHDPPYWRGAIWINVNLMAVQALRHYAAQPGPHQGAAAELHAALREALLSNLVGQYQSSGFLWEQYDDASGAGKGSHPFTGWTGLLALLAAAD